jgi:hypothetical protein
MEPEDLIGKTFKFNLEKVKQKYGPNTHLGVLAVDSTFINPNLDGFEFTIKDKQDHKFICTSTELNIAGRDFYLSQADISAWTRQEIISQQGRSRGFHRHGYGESGFEWL